MRETRRRSFLKAITYRITMSIVGFLTAYYITGSVEKSIQVITIYFAGSIFIYYIHERIWNRIKWGKEDN